MSNRTARISLIPVGVDTRTSTVSLRRLTFVTLELTSAFSPSLIAVVEAAWLWLVPPVDSDNRKVLSLDEVLKGQEVKKR